MGLTLSRPAPRLGDADLELSGDLSLRRSAMAGGAMRPPRRARSRTVIRGRRVRPGVAISLQDQARGTEKVVDGAA